MPEWPDDKIEFLKNNWGKLETKWIAADLGITKNAVIGKAYRLGLCQPRSPVDPWVRAARKKAREKEYRQHWRQSTKGVAWIKNKAMTKRESRKTIKPRPAKDTPHPTNIAVTLNQRKPTQCAFLVGHHLMCGAPVFQAMDAYGNLKNTSWCEYHTRIVFHFKGAA